MKRKSPHLPKAPRGLPRLSHVCFFTQVETQCLSGLLAVVTEAGLKFTTVVPGGPFAMMNGTILMPPSSAACWVTPEEGPCTKWELVSEAPAKGLFPRGVDVAFSRWWGVGK